VPTELPLREDHPQKPINPYGWTKLMMEQTLQDFDTAYGIRHAALRYFNAAGADPDCEIGEEHDPETHLIPLVIAATQGKRGHVEIYGTDYDTPDGTCIRDYIHVTDLAVAHIQALEYLQDKDQSLIVNLGTGNGQTVREVIRAVEKVSGKTTPVKEGPRRPGDPPGLYAYADKAYSLLGWKPQYGDIETIVDTAWKWHEKK